MPIVKRSKPKEKTIEEYMEEASTLKDQMDALKQQQDAIKETLLLKFRAAGLESVEHNGFTFSYVKGFPTFSREKAVEYAVIKHHIPMTTMKDIFDNGKGEPGEDYLQIRRNKS